jgi:hypothetical protein
VQHKMVEKVWYMLGFFATTSFSTAIYR